MKDLFMLLLDILKYEGDITAASMNINSKWATIDLAREDATYTISISKEEKKNED